MHCFVALTKCVANDKLFCKSFLLAYFLFICIDWHGMCKEIFSNVKSAMLVTCLCNNLSFLSDDINTTAWLRLKNVKCFIITYRTMIRKSKILRNTYLNYYDKCVYQSIKGTSVLYIKLVSQMIINQIRFALQHLFYLQSDHNYMRHELTIFRGHNNDAIYVLLFSRISAHVN